MTMVCHLARKNIRAEVAAITWSGKKVKMVTFGGVSLIQNAPIR
jgi:hypothetical protein